MTLPYIASRHSFMRGCAWQIAAASLLVGCWSTTDASDGDATLGPEPVFPADLSAWAEARSCAHSHEHELRYIRVLVDAAAKVPYEKLNADHPYPVGATLVKLEYDDSDCTQLLGYTAMQKRASGAYATGNDWRWQRVNNQRRVTEDGALSTCIGCHSHHCTEPACGYVGCGFDLTCGEEETP